MLLKHVPCFITPWLFSKRWHGFATPFAIFLRQPDVEVEAHEREHVRQIWAGWVIGFGIKYCYYLAKYGYWNNPYEVQARQVAAQAYRAYRLQRTRG